MWEVNHLGLQDWEFFNAAMNLVKMTKLGIGCAVLVFFLCLLVGCTSRKPAQTHRDETNPFKHVSYWRGIEPKHIAKLMIAGNDGHTHTFTNLVTVNEPVFVQSLYRDLASRESSMVKRYLMVGQKLLVFADEESNMLCSFLYWPAGKPEHIFTPCQAHRSGNAYQVDWPASRTPSVTLPGFDKRVRGYLDVWK